MTLNFFSSGHKPVTRRQKCLKVVSDYLARHPLIDHIVVLSLRELIPDLPRVSEKIKPPAGGWQPEDEDQERF